jgi:hypothetical protein
LRRRLITDLFLAVPVLIIPVSIVSFLAAAFSLTAFSVVFFLVAFLVAFFLTVFLRDGYGLVLILILRLRLGNGKGGKNKISNFFSDFFLTADFFLVLNDLDGFSFSVLNISCLSISLTFVSKSAVDFLAKSRGQNVNGLGISRGGVSSVKTGGKGVATYLLRLRRGFAGETRFLKVVRRGPLSKLSFFSAYDLIILIKIFFKTRGFFQNSCKRDRC